MSLVEATTSNGQLPSQNNTNSATATKTLTHEEKMQLRKEKFKSNDSSTDNQKVIF